VSYSYHMGLWDKLQHQSAMRRLERERRQAVAAYVQQHQQSNTPEGASGCSQAVVSHEGRAVAARGSRPQVNAGMNSARATVSTTAAASTENPGNDHQAPLTGLVAGARLQQAKQIIGQRGLF
jgi:hypothetical protein